MVSGRALALDPVLTHAHGFSFFKRHRGALSSGRVTQRCKCAQVLDYLNNPPACLATATFASFDSCSASDSVSRFSQGDKLCLFFFYLFKQAVYYLSLCFLATYRRLLVNTHLKRNATFYHCTTTSWTATRFILTVRLTVPSCLP